MLTLILNILIAAILGTILTLCDISPWYWSILWSFLLFLAGQFAVGLIFKKRILAVSNEVQQMMMQGQEKIKQKMQRWTTRPVGNAKQAQQIIENDQREIVKQAQQTLKNLEHYRLWVPLLGRQIATMELQFAWQLRDFQRVDVLLPRALFIEPVLHAVRLTRMYMKKEDMAQIRKQFKKSVKRLRYGQSTIVYSTFAWMLLQNGETKEAFRIITEANDKNEHPVLKANRDALANNKIAHFSNAGLGDEWYMLFLEEPKIKTQRQRPNARFF